MTNQHVEAAIRVVIAAPFKELVDIHDRASEFADELDVCGVVSNPTSVVEQAQVLNPDVLILSEALGADPADVVSRLATGAPGTKLVMLVRDRNAAMGTGTTALRLDATGSELRAAVKVAAGRLRNQTAPAAHAGAGAGNAASPRWFWEDRGTPVVSPSASPAKAEEAPQAALPTVADPAAVPAEASSWPPPWLHIDADDEDRFTLGTSTPATRPAAGVTPPPAVAPAPATPQAVPQSEVTAQVPPGGDDLPARRESTEVAPAPAEGDDKPRSRGWMRRAAPPASEAADPPLFDLAFPTAPSSAATVGASPPRDDPPASAPSRPHEGADAGAAVALSAVPSSPEVEWGTRAPRAEPAPVADPAPAVVPVALPAPAPVVAPTPAVAPAYAPEPAATVAPTPPAEPELPEEPIVEQPKTRVRQPGRTRADTVLVFSGKGGVGKSVVATNLAVALSARGAKVALIDLNLQYGDVGVLLHIESHPTSIELLAQQGEQVDRDYLDEVMATGPEALRVLLAPASPEFADLVTAASLRAVLRELSRTYDYVVVDSPAHLEERVLEVIEMAEQILVVSSFNITSVKDTRVTLRLLQSLGVERERIAVVLNQTQAKVGFTKADIEKSMRYEVLAQLPHDVHVDDTVDSGRPMVLGHPKSDFAKQFRAIVDFIAAANTEPAAASPEEAGARPKRRIFGR